MIVSPIPLKSKSIFEPNFDRRSPTVSPSLDLQEILSSDQKLEAIRILKETIDGLHHIHETCKMVHLDLKPHNIFLTEDLQVKIGDFGLVKKLSRAVNANGSTASTAANKQVQSVNKQLLPLTAMIYNSITNNYNNSLSAVSTSPSENNSCSAAHDKLPFYLPKEEITSTCGTAAYASPE